MKKFQTNVLGFVRIKSNRKQCFLYFLTQVNKHNCILLHLWKAKTVKQAQYLYCFLPLQWLKKSSFGVFKSTTCITSLSNVAPVASEVWEVPLWALVATQEHISHSWIHTSASEHSAASLKSGLQAAPRARGTANSCQLPNISFHACSWLADLHWRC